LQHKNTKKFSKKKQKAGFLFIHIFEVLMSPTFTNKKAGRGVELPKPLPALLFSF
jgi:hypothetical protein